MSALVCKQMHRASDFARKLSWLNRYRQVRICETAKVPVSNNFVHQPNQPSRVAKKKYIRLTWQQVIRAGQNTLIVDAVGRGGVSDCIDLVTGSAAKVSAAWWINLRHTAYVFPYASTSSECACRFLLFVRVLESSKYLYGLLPSR